MDNEKLEKLLDIYDKLTDAVLSVRQSVRDIDNDHVREMVENLTSRSSALGEFIDDMPEYKEWSARKLKELGLNGHSGEVVKYYGNKAKAARKAQEKPEFLLKNCTRCEDSLLHRVAGGLAPDYLVCHNVRSAFYCKKVDATKSCPEWREIGEKK